MSGNFDTDLQTMQAAAKHVGDVNEQIQQQLSDLLNRLEPLKGAWKGEGSTKFTSLVERWHEDASQLNQVLASIGERLGATHANISRDEEGVGSGMDSIAGRLG